MHIAKGEDPDKEENPLTVSVLAVCPTNHVRARFPHFSLKENCEKA